MRPRLLGVALLIVAAGVTVAPAAHAFVPPGGTSRSAIICNGGYKPGTPCVVAPPQLLPCPGGATGCLQVAGTEVPFLHDGGLLAAQFPPAVPGHPVQLEFYNEGCKTSVPQTIWAGDGTQFEGQQTITSLHSLGVIPRTPPGHSRALSFSLPTDLLMMYVSIDAPAARSACSYPPVQGVWLTIGNDSCSVHAGRQAPAATASCDKLDVTAKPVQRIASGLNKDEEAFFGGPKDACFSGCADVLVTVTDHRTHKPVRNAVVSASVTPISARDIPSYPAGQAGDGYLCDQADQHRCGSGRLITDLRTNASGHLRLRYWAPGLIADGHMTVTVKARENCHGSSCPKTGEFTTGELTVRRNVIYRRDATLSPEEATTLADWPENTLFEVGQKQATEVELDNWLTLLVRAERLTEHAAHHLGEGLERISGALEIAEAATAAWKQQGFMAMFFDKFGLSGTGLGRAPEDRMVTAAPSTSFQTALAGDGIPPLHLFQKGLLWNYGAQLAFIHEESKAPVGAQSIHLYVYEVSYCGQAEVCGADYHGSTGIHPYLEFQLISDSAGREDFEGHFLTPYNARAWMDTQFGK
jgi:hypothetical protein